MVDLMFFECLETASKRVNEENWDIHSDPETIFQTMHGLARELFHDTLYDKLTHYQASLLKKTCRVFEDTLLITPHELVDAVKAHIDMESSLDESEIYRSFQEKTEAKQTRRKIQKRNQQIIDTL